MLSDTFRFLAGGADAVVARLLDGEAMTDVSRAYPARPVTRFSIATRNANQLPQQVESLIVRLKAEKPHWGARKIRELLVRRLDGDVRVPAKSALSA